LHKLSQIEMVFVRQSDAACGIMQRQSRRQTESGISCVSEPPFGESDRAGPSINHYPITQSVVSFRRSTLPVYICGLR